MAFLNDPQKILNSEDFYSLNQRLQDYQNFAKKTIQIDINTSSPSLSTDNEIIVSVNTSQQSLVVNPDFLKFLLPQDTNTYFQFKDYAGLVNETQENLINYLQDPRKYAPPQHVFQFQSSDIYLGLLLLISAIVWLTYFFRQNYSSSN